MPGANCCIVGCTTYADSKKYPALSLSAEKSALIKDWKTKLLHIVGRADKTFNPDRAFICSRHFTAECIRTGK